MTDDRPTCYRCNTTLTNTHQIKPGALMPATTPEPDELHALLDFLESLE